MNEIRNAVIAVVVALVVSAGLAGFMYKGVQAVNIEKTLHVYDYPKTGRFLTSRDVNPAAAYALLRVQAMKTIPRNFNHLSMQTHTSDDRIFDLIRTVAIYRGGAAAMTCESSRSDVTACRLEAVLPADMAQDLGDLQDAGIPEYQRWIDRQPVRPTWRDKGVAEFTITNVEVLMLEAKTGAWRSDYGVHPERRHRRADRRWSDLLDRRAALVGNRSRLGQVRDAQPGSTARP